MRALKVAWLFLKTGVTQNMKKPTKLTTGRLETEDDLEQAVAKIAHPNRGRTKVKRKFVKKDANEEDEE